AWWRGLWVDNRRVGADLMKQLDKLTAPLRAQRDRYLDPFEAAEAAVRGPIRDIRSPTLRAMRRLVRGDENLRSALHALLEFVFGGEPIWDLEDVGLAEDVEEHSPRELVNQAL